jgi:hypothetical protein
VRARTRFWAPRFVAPLARIIPGNEWGFSHVTTGHFVNGASDSHLGHHLYHLSQCVWPRVVQASAAELAVVTLAVHLAACAVAIHARITQVPLQRGNGVGNIRLRGGGGGGGGILS